MRILIIVLSTLLFLLLLFFGMGPVVFADGSTQERVITAAITLLLMFGVVVLAKHGMKKFPKNK